jgi:hypothetical protein
MVRSVERPQGLAANEVDASIQLHLHFELKIGGHLLETRAGVCWHVSHSSEITNLKGSAPA